MNQDRSAVMTVWIVLAPRTAAQCMTRLSDFSADDRAVSEPGDSRPTNFYEIGTPFFFLIAFPSRTHYT